MLLVNAALTILFLSDTYSEVRTISGLPMQRRILCQKAANYYKILGFLPLRWQVSRVAHRTKNHAVGR